MTFPNVDAVVAACGTNGQCAYDAVYLQQAVLADGGRAAAAQLVADAFSVHTR